MVRDIILKKFLQTGMGEDGSIVEIFCTNVPGEVQASQLVEKMVASFPHFRINFDLEDCDRVLRVKGRKIEPREIIAIVESEGYECCLME